MCWKWWGYGTYTQNTHTSLTSPYHLPHYPATPLSHQSPFYTPLRRSYDYPRFRKSIHSHITGWLIHDRLHVRDSLRSTLIHQRKSTLHQHPELPIPIHTPSTGHIMQVGNLYTSQAHGLIALRKVLPTQRTTNGSMLYRVVFQVIVDGSRKRTYTTRDAFHERFTSLWRIHSIMLHPQHMTHIQHVWRTRSNLWLPPPKNLT